MTENKTIHAADYGLPLYFDMQAKMGHTKHFGGLAVTQRLAELCQLGPGKTALNVGSGSGIAATYVAKNYRCRVVGVDLLPEMVISAQRWAEEQGFAEQMEFRVGDAQDLPFDDSQFDAVISESGKRNRQTIPPKIREAALARARHRCESPGCGHTRFLEVHHVVPRARGGTNELSNLRVLCSACHRFHHLRNSKAPPPTASSTPTRAVGEGLSR